MRQTRRCVGSQDKSRRQLGKRQLTFERLETRELLAADVVISEFLASNSGGLRDGDGDSSDWIELFNTTSSSVSLTGYSLTDDREKPRKWSFPAGTTIGAHSTLLVFASDKGAAGPAGELHTNFKLGAEGEYLGLFASNGQTVIHEFSPAFPPQTTNISYGLSMPESVLSLVNDQTPMRYFVPTNNSIDGVWRSTSFNDFAWSQSTAGLGFEASPGPENPTDFSSLIDATVPIGTTSAYSRFSFDLQDSKSLTSLDLRLTYDDGFVAYLNGQLVASSFAPAVPAWNSSAVNANRSDDVVLSGYVSFDLKSSLSALKSGNNVLAIHALNAPSSPDFLMIPQLVAKMTTIAEPLVSGNFAVVTPNKPNGGILAGVVADTSFSVDRGFFASPFYVEVTTTTPGALIVYTTDGSAPTVDTNLNITNGTQYAAPILISATTTLRAAAFKPQYISTNTDTQTYIFLDDVIKQTRQSALAAGFPATWGARISDYGLDPDVIGPNDLFGGVYAAQIKQSLEAIPSMSITVDNADFFGPNGIYSNPTGQGVAWERPASAELIFPDGTEGFQIDAGLRLAGAASRSLSLKDGLRLLFKSEYGSGKLNYPLFGDGVSSFDTIVLRPHFNDGWGWDGALGDPLYIRDQWFRDTQEAMGNPSSRGTLVHLYINGLYWGLYNPSERPDASYSAETFGGNKEDYDVMYHAGVQDGTSDTYATMIALAQSVAAASDAAAKMAAYQKLQGNYPNGQDNPATESYLDVATYIDYLILNQYGGNNDWPNNNWYATRRRGAESEGFKFISWDSEISLALSSRTSINENNLSQITGAAEAYGILRNFSEFRMQFADQIHQHLFNGGALSVNPTSPAYDPAQPENNVPAARFAALADEIALSIVAESARWGDQHTTFPRTKNTEWQNSLNYMLGTYFRNRYAIILNQWRASGLYPATDAPEFVVDAKRQHGGEVQAGALLSFQNSNSGALGEIYFTTDGTDPRLPGGGINTASAVRYASAYAFSRTTSIKARILRNGEWSALTEATFNAVNADFNVDGTVDGADFLAWQRGFGISSNASLSQGDANGDGAVDAGDLSSWRTQFGSIVLPAALTLPSVSEFVVPNSVTYDSSAPMAESDFEGALATPLDHERRDAQFTHDPKSTYFDPTASGRFLGDGREQSTPSHVVGSHTVRRAQLNETVDVVFSDLQGSSGPRLPIGKLMRHEVFGKAISDGERSPWSYLAAICEKEDAPTLVEGRLR